MNSASAMPCRGCGRAETDVALDLGELPASDYFPAHAVPGPDPTWPLTWVLCRHCRLVQLGPVSGVLPESPMGRESVTSLQHATLMAGRVVANLGIAVGASFIEIDSHHGGSWRSAFSALGLIEREPDDTADLVVDVHGIAHSADLREPLAAHARRVAPGGWLVFEFHHLLELVRQDQIDTIRHGHWVYLSLLSMARLLAEHGFTIVRADAVDVFGGSLVLTAQRTSESPSVDPGVAELQGAEQAGGLSSLPELAAFGRRGLARAALLREHLRHSAAEGRSVAGYGAPSKAPVLLALAGVDAELLPYTVDISATKDGCRLPHVGVPIHSVDHLIAQRPNEVVVLTWDIATEIVSQLAAAAEEAGWDPDFLVPLPELRYVAGPRHRASQQPTRT